jgi:hypothetical protein
MLRSGIVTPLHAYTFRLVATAVSLGVISAVVALSTRRPTVDMPPPPPSAVHLVFRAQGETYMKLRDADPMPAHGAPVLHVADEASAWQTSSIAEIAEVPGWRGRTVMIDGHCEAKVTGFAVVARLTGSPDYAGDFQTWTADNVLAQGAPVAAAKLDGCADGAIATTAVTLVAQQDAALATQARAKLLGSKISGAAQRTWIADKRTGKWYADDSATIETLVATSAKAKYVSVTGRIDEGCGGPEIQIWGLYRVEGDALVVVYERRLEDLRSVQSLVDVDDDGTPEVLGASWLGNETILWRPSQNDELERVSVPFCGCPC